MKLPVSVLIMSQNEELNIRYAIESVIERFEQIIVTDSFSNDRTFEICKSYASVEIYRHRFESWAAQRNWMLANCSIKTNKVFFLDADEFVQEDFVNELAKILSSQIPFTSIFVKPKLIFLNKHLKYAYGHPKIKRIFNKEGLKFFGAGAREYAIDEGPSITMNSPLIHHDRRPISIWIDKHNRNSDREADLFFQKMYTEICNESFTGKITKTSRIKLWIRRNVWDRLPLVYRSFFYFFYRYFFQLGFLDGKIGFVYCFLHALWYQILIDIKIIERLQNESKNEKDW